MERRYFYRHRIPIPIRVQTSKKTPKTASESIDLSYGGLGFMWEKPLVEGSVIFVTIPFKNTHFELRARVAYSEHHETRNLYHIGATFMDEVTAFKTRLAEQVLEISRYREHLSRILHREVSEEDAAAKWISKYAKRFSEVT